MPTELVGLGTELLLHLHGHPFLMLLQGGTSGNPAKGLDTHLWGWLALPPGLGPHGGQPPTSPPALGPGCAVASSCTTPLAWVGVRRRSRHSLPGHESGGRRELSPTGHRGKVWGGGPCHRGSPAWGHHPGPSTARSEGAKPYPAFKFWAWGWDSM